jgi:predicted RNA binding protein YcfA (HicA-like mRNA interferase family)
MKLNIVSGRDMCKNLEKIEFKKIHQVRSLF